MPYGNVWRYAPFAKNNPQSFDPRAFFLAAMEELKSLVSDRFERFGTAGQAHKIKPIALAEMASRYTSGELDPYVVSK